MPDNQPDGDQTALTVDSIVIAPPAQETELVRAYHLGELQKAQLESFSLPTLLSDKIPHIGQSEVEHA